MALRSWTGLRPSELRRVGPLTLANASVMAALYLLKPARNALFLDRFGVDHLPYAMLMVAALGALAASVYARFGAAVRVDRAQAMLFGLFVASLLGFRLLFTMGWSWVYYLFYVWVALLGLIATSLVWQLANASFNAREARRFFGLVGTGGIGGAIAGGFLTSMVAGSMGTENLVYVAASLLVVAWFCMRMPYDTRRIRTPRAEPTGGAFEEIRQSTLLSSLAWTGVLVAVVAVIIDVQFNEVAQRFVPTTDAKAAFFGRFFAYLNLFAIVVQLLLTPRVLTRFGIGVGLLVLPAALGLGSVMLALLPGLLPGILPKLADGSLRHSLHKSATEILFIPIPTPITRRAKLFLDATVDSLATGLGALLVLLLVNQLGFTYRALSGLALSLILVWLWVARRTHAAYIDAFRSALTRRQIDFDELRINVADAATLDTLVTALDTPGTRPIQYALDMLAPIADERLGRRLPQLLSHAEPGVRVRALRVLNTQRGEHMDAVAPLLSDPDHGVRVEAARYVCQHGSQPPPVQLADWLTSNHTATQTAALGAIAAYGSEEERALLGASVIDSLLALEGVEGVRARADVATILALQPRDDLQSYWLRLRSDTAEPVVRSAIAGAGRSGKTEHLAWLFELIDDKRYRMDARLALAAYGEQVLDEIERRLQDPAVTDRVKRTLPRVLARVDSPRSVPILLSLWPGADEILRRAILSALEKLRARFEELSFDDPRIESLLHDEISSYYVHRDVARVLESEAATPGMRLLGRALAEKQGEALARVFRLLALRYRPEDMRTTYRALVGKDKELRAGALELIDNVLPREIKDRILPMFEHRSVPPGVSVYPPRTAEQGYARLMEGADPWLRALALDAMRGSDSTMFRSWAERAAHDGDALVRETAMAGLGDPMVDRA